MDSRQLREVEPPPTLGARLRRARRRRFVGRAGELELFRAAVEGPGASWGVLFVYGPGEVGKTALLAAFAEAAEAVGVPAWRVDLRGVELSPPGFLAAVAGAMGVADGAAAVATLGSGGRRVLLLDTYESAAGLDRWVREGFLPGLGAESRVVVAGRDAPSRGWLDDAGWRDLLRVVALRNLSPGEAGAFLRTAGVAEYLHQPVLELTHGHPLALSLLVDVLDQRGDEAGVLGFDLGQAPDVLGVLLERFVAGVPSERHRQALEVCAHSRVTTEDLLRTALGGEDPGALFEWLRGLSFVRAARRRSASTRAPTLGQQVRECLARLPRTTAIGVNGTDDVGDLCDRTIGQRSVRALGGRTPQEFRNRFALAGGGAADELVELLVEANTTHTAHSAVGARRARLAWSTRRTRRGRPPSPPRSTAPVPSA